MKSGNKIIERGSFLRENSLPLAPLKKHTKGPYTVYLPLLCGTRIMRCRRALLVLNLLARKPSSMHKKECPSKRLHVWPVRDLS